jgi:HNH endonuclease
MPTPILNQNRHRPPSPTDLSQSSAVVLTNPQKSPPAPTSAASAPGAPPSSPSQLGPTPAPPPSPFPPSLPHPPQKLIPHPRAHPINPPSTPRTPSLGLRHRILKRDNFKCTHCGRSPATHPNVILHIDHILPWSKGGPTTPDNLQTLCDQCNRGKATT